MTSTSLINADVLPQKRRDVSLCGATLPPSVPSAAQRVCASRFSASVFAKCQGSVDASHKISAPLWVCEGVGSPDVPLLRLKAFVPLFVCAVCVCVLLFSACAGMLFSAVSTVETPSYPVLHPAAPLFSVFPCFSVLICFVLPFQSVIFHRALKDGVIRVGSF